MTFIFLILRLVYVTHSSEDVSGRHREHKKPWVAKPIAKLCNHFLFNVRDNIATFITFHHHQHYVMLAMSTCTSTCGVYGWIVCLSLFARTRLPFPNCKEEEQARNRRLYFPSKQNCNGCWAHKSVLQGNLGGYSKRARLTSHTVRGKMKK